MPDLLPNLSPVRYPSISVKYLLLFLLYSIPLCSSRPTESTSVSLELLDTLSTDGDQAVTEGFNDRRPTSRHRSKPALYTLFNTMSRRAIDDNSTSTENQKAKVKNEEKMKERKNPLCYFTALSCKPRLNHLKSEETTRRRRRRHANRVVFD